MLKKGYVEKWRKLTWSKPMINLTDKLIFLFFVINSTH